MKSLFWLAALPLFGWSLAAGQADVAHHGLVRVGAQDSEPGNGGSASAVGALPNLTRESKEVWRKELTTSDLDQREKAYDRLLEQLSNETALRAWIEELSKGDDELAWTARLALRASEDRALAPFGQRLRRGLAPGGIDPLLIDPFGSHDPFPDLLGGTGLDMDAWLRGFGLDAGGRWNLGNAPFGSQHSSESISVESTPNGVRIEVRTNNGTDEDVKVYEGETMDALLAEHPELKDKVGVGTTFPRFEFPLRRLGGSSPFLPGVESVLPSRAVLGVYLDPAALAEGNLVVTRVAESSFADKLGVQVGDRLFELDGHPLKSREDVAKALNDRSDADLMQLRVVGPDGKERKLRWQPDL